MDLGAEQWIEAERGMEHLAIEIKNYSGRSAVYEMHQAVGQYITYQAVLHKEKSERIVYLATTRSSYQRFFQNEPGLSVIEFYPLNIIIVDEDAEEVEEWIRNSGINS